MKKILVLCFILFYSAAAYGQQYVDVPELGHYTKNPLLLVNKQKPAVMLVLTKDHKMFMQAYNNVSDLDDDGKLDIGFNPGFTYVGVFDPNSCYTYNGDINNGAKVDDKEMFVRSGPATPQTAPEDVGTILGDKDFPTKTSVCGVCTGADDWSGNWLNWATSSRMDVVRKVLYGGYRLVDTPEETVLRSDYIQRNSHVWGVEIWADDMWKEKSASSPYYDATKFTGLSKPASGMVHMVARYSVKMRVAHDISPVVPQPYQAVESGRVLPPEGFHVWDWVIVGSPASRGEERPKELDPNHIYGGGAPNHGFIMNERTKAIPKMTDYNLNVKACETGNLETDGSCRRYGSGYKPAGLLQKYGESGDMLFGLLTNNYGNGSRRDGGVVRHDVARIAPDQIDLATGIYKKLGEDNKSASIMHTIDLMRLVTKREDWGNGVKVWSWPMPAQSNFGNPLGEMVFEATRYFSDQATNKYSKTPIATNFFSSVAWGLDGEAYDHIDGVEIDFKQNLPYITKWNSPITQSGAVANDTCVKPVIMILSDVYNSYDADSMPGSPHNQEERFDLAAADMTRERIPSITKPKYNELPKTFSMNAYLEAITAEEIDPKKLYFVANTNRGEATGSNVGGSDENLCMPKKIENLAMVRGLCPVEPQMYGSYSVAAVAFYGHTHEMVADKTTEGTTTALEQNIDYYAVALPSPFPEIKFSAPKGTIAFMPQAVVAQAFDDPGDWRKKAMLSTNAINTYIIDWQTDDNNNPYRGAVWVNFDDVLEGSSAGYSGDYDRDVPARYYFDLIMECDSTCSFGGRVPKDIMKNKIKADLLDYKTDIGYRYDAVNDVWNKTSDWINDRYIERKYLNYDNYRDPRYIKTSLDETYDQSSSESDYFNKYGEVIDWYGYIGEPGIIYRKVAASGNIEEGIKNAIGISMFTYALDSDISNHYPASVGYVISGTEADGLYLDIVSDSTVPHRTVAHKSNTPPTCKRADTPHPSVISTPLVNTHDLIANDLVRTVEVDDDPGTWIDINNNKAPECGSPLLPLTATRLFAFNKTGAAEYPPNPLWLAAKYGGFKEGRDANGVPDKLEEWSTKGRNMPDNYFPVNNPAYMMEQMDMALKQISSDMVVGTANSSAVNSVLGGGLTIRTYYYTEYEDDSENKDNPVTIAWVGGTYALFMDQWNNMREDTNRNGKLDIVTGEGERGLSSKGDWVVEFISDTNGKPMVNFHRDLLGHNDINLVEPKMGDVIGPRPLEDINTVWDFNRQISTMENVTAVRPFNSNSTQGRRVYFFNSDASINNGVSGHGFKTPYTFGDNNLFKPDEAEKLAPYLMIGNRDMYSPVELDAGNGDSMSIQAWDNGFSNVSLRIASQSDSDCSGIAAGKKIAHIMPLAGGANDNIEITVCVRFDSTSDVTANELYGYINSEPAFTSWFRALSPTNGGKWAVPQGWRKTYKLTEGNAGIVDNALIRYILGEDVAGGRPRTVNSPWDGSGEKTVWRLGDVVNSQPVIVRNPLMGHDTIYRDMSYLQFKRKYDDRRQVAYFGANDGMLHAVNMGFYGSLKDGQVGYSISPLNKEEGSEELVKYELGQEMWSFIPQAVLPHLQWLKDNDYSRADGHSYYVDFSPVSVDVKNTSGKDITASNGTYTWKAGEWRTILLCGLRLGGRTIDLSSTVGNNPDDPVYFYSEYFALDITDPEVQPTLIWRFDGKEKGKNNGSQLGLTVARPMLVRNNAGGSDNFYVVLGSGPTFDDPEGRAIAQGNEAYNGYSNQQARVFVLDALTGELVRTLPDASNTSVSPENPAYGPSQAKIIPPNSFFSDLEALPGMAGSVRGRGTENTSWANPVVYLSLTQSLPPGYSLDCNYFNKNNSPTDYNAENPTQALYPGCDPKADANSYLDRGGVYRVQMSDSSGNILPVKDWYISLFYETDRPVTVPVNLTSDPRGNIWVIFGTGRLWDGKDIKPCVNVASGDYKSCQINHLNFLYGLKERMSNGIPTFETIADNSRVRDVSNVKIYRDGTIKVENHDKTEAEEGYKAVDRNGATTYLNRYSDLRNYTMGSLSDGYRRSLTMDKVTGDYMSINAAEVDNPNMAGNDGAEAWWRNIDYEMLLYTPTLYAVSATVSVMFFTTFEPSSDPCSGAGSGYMYGVDTYTGLSRPDMWYYTANKKKNNSDYYGMDDSENPQITGVIWAGDGKPTGVTMFGNEAITNNQGGGQHSQKVPEAADTSNGVLSWREVLDMGFDVNDGQEVGDRK
ncbi:hypothetical protein C4J81_02990 [Deltaproteobacteria bacterium Smac51]|nr:hypothetical protein C4J81_02990 [Deltaproteobacteria bacterium Smac51]